MCLRNELIDPVQVLSLLKLTSLRRSQHLWKMTSMQRMMTPLKKMRSQNRFWTRSLWLS